MNAKLQKRDYRKWRLSGIGSADAAAIMGDSPWMTKHELWEIFTERRSLPEVTYPMKRGLIVEPIALRCYRDLTGIAVKKAAPAIHQNYPFLRASLDARDNDKTHRAELKAPGIRAHCMALNGVIPRQYIWQLIHQMMVEQVNEINYFSFYFWKKVPNNFAAPNFENWDKVPKTFAPKESFSWEKFPKFPIWNPSYRDHLCWYTKNLVQSLGLNPLNCQILTLHQNQELADQLLEEEIKFWELVKRDIPPGEEKMSDKPKLTLVTEKKSGMPGIFEPSMFKSRESRPTSTNQIRAMLRAKEAKQKTKRKKTMDQKPKNAMRYSAKEIVEVLERAKELGIEQIRFAGNDVTFQPQRRVREEDQQEVEQVEGSEDSLLCDCGSPKTISWEGQLYSQCRECYYEAAPKRRRRGGSRPPYSRGRGRY